MPIVCRFFGVVIAFYFDDHAPAHFHARYSGHEATFSIDTLSLLEGSLPPRVHGFVIEWASQHKLELRENWERARLKQPLAPIPPLE